MLLNCPASEKRGGGGRKTKSRAHIFAKYSDRKCRERIVFGDRVYSTEVIFRSNVVYHFFKKIFCRFDDLSFCVQKYRGTIFLFKTTEIKFKILQVAKKLPPRFSRAVYRCTGGAFLFVFVFALTDCV